MFRQRYVLSNNYEAEEQFLQTGESKAVPVAVGGLRMSANSVIAKEMNI